MPDNYIKQSDAKKILSLLPTDLDAETVQRCIEAIGRIPAADVEPKQRWIPVTERLPEVDKQVLVYAVGKIDGFIGESIIAISERMIFSLFPWSNGEETWSPPWQYFLTDFKITHWMPLPEPPKGEEG